MFPFFLHSFYNMGSLAKSIHPHDRSLVDSAHLSEGRVQVWGDKNLLPVEYDQAASLRGAPNVGEGSEFRIGVQRDLKEFSPEMITSSTRLKPEQPDPSSRQPRHIEG